MSTLTIQLFGEFHLAIDGKPITAIQPGRQQTLLAYLLLHRSTPLSRRHLAFLFWPDSSETQAHANLRQLLHHIRHALPSIEQYLKLEGRTIQWRPDLPFRLDVAEFEQAMAQASAAERAGNHAALRQALEHAVERYGGDLLHSCYDDWVLPERERWREKFTAALDSLVALLEAMRDYPAAIRYAQRLLHHDPLHEITYRRLMTLYAANGERANALRTYHTCVTVLERELGVTPQAATQTLYARLLDAAAQSVAPPATDLAAHRLVGRQNAWATLQRLWRMTLHGQPQIAFVYGEPGLGKTHLLEEMLHWADQQGVTTARTRSYAAEGALAYAPVIDWLRSEAVQGALPKLATAHRAELTRLLPESSSSAPPVSQPATLGARVQRLHLHAALAQAILQTRQPLLLVIDDLQWCDQETTEWLHYLVRNLQNAQVLLLGAARPEELTDQHPLQPLRADLRSAGQLTEIELAPLSAQETAELATLLASESLSIETQQQIYQVSEGSPLFVVEIVRNRLHALEGGHRPPAPAASSFAATALPARLYAIIHARLAQISPQAREVASLAAICGRAFTFDLLAYASDTDEATLVRGLDELWRRRLVREQGLHAYDFSHDAIREVAALEIGPALRRRLHGRVAEALRRMHAHDPDEISGELAMHFHQASQMQPAIDWYRRAASVAADRFDYARSAGYLNTALTLLESLPSTAERNNLEFTLLRAQITNLSIIEGFTGPEMAKTFRRVYAIVEQLHDEQLRFYAYRDLRWYACATGAMDQAHRHAEAVLHLAQRLGDRASLTEAYTGMGIVYRYIGQQLRAREYLEHAMRLAENDLGGEEHSDDSVEDVHLHPTTCANLALTLWLLGYLDQARAMLAQAVAEALVAGKPFDFNVVFFFGSILCRHLRDVDGVADLGRRLLEVGERYDMRTAWIDGVNSLGWLQAMQGDLAGGSARMRASIDEYNALHHRLMQPHRLGLLLSVQIQAHANDAAAATLKEALALSAQTGEYGWDADLHRLKGELLHATNAPPDEVLAAYEQAIEIARHQHAKILELRATTSLCRFLAHRGQRTAAATRLQALYAWFTEGFDTHDLREAKSLLDELDVETA